MGIHYENLDDSTRRYMLEEVTLGGHYISPHLTPTVRPLGQSSRKKLLDITMMTGLQRSSWPLDTSEPEYTCDGITGSRRINQPNAVRQLGVGEFNRDYIRGLCSRPKADGKMHLVIY